MSKMNDFVFQMMLESSIFEESQNECAAQKQIEHDKGVASEYLQEITTSAGEAAIRGNEEVGAQQICGILLF